MKDRMSIMRHKAATHTKARDISKRLRLKAMNGLPYCDFVSSSDNWLPESLKALWESTAKAITTPISNK
jgi:hypothetical protein